MLNIWKPRFQVLREVINIISEPVSFLSVSKTSLQREKAKPVLGKHYFGEDGDLKQIIMGYHMKRGMPSEEIEKGLNLYIALSLICNSQV